MTPNEIETQRVRGQVACVLKSTTVPDNMQAARGHLDDAQRALSSGRGRMADEIERLVEHAGQASGAARIDALQDQCGGLEINLANSAEEIKRLRTGHEAVREQVHKTQYAGLKHRVNAELLCSEILRITYDALASVSEPDKWPAADEDRARLREIIRATRRHRRDRALPGK